MTLKEWVRANGGTEGVARRFNINDRTVRLWLAGVTSPTAKMMVRLVRASKGSLTCDQIVSETQRVKL